MITRSLKSERDKEKRKKKKLFKKVLTNRKGYDIIVKPSRETDKELEP